jgi:hypothetical protein
LGKTVAALVPALAWLAEKRGRRVAYLVNRVNQHDNPLRELRAGLADRFREAAGRPPRVVDIVGREQLCLEPDSRPLADVCKRSSDEAAFDQLPGPLASWQEVRDHLGTARCPYHTLQGLINDADLVLCDYGWLFSQPALGGDLAHLLDLSVPTAAIIDEAHNLPLRVRAELDVNLSFTAFSNAIKQDPSAVRACLEPILAAVAESDPGEGRPPSALLPLGGGRQAVEAALEAFEDDPEADARPGPAQRLLRLLLRPDDEVVLHLLPADEAEGGPRFLARLARQDGRPEREERPPPEAGRAEGREAGGGGRAAAGPGAGAAAAAAAALPREGSAAAGARDRRVQYPRPGAGPRGLAGRHRHPARGPQRGGAQTGGGQDVAFSEGCPSPRPFFVWSATPYSGYPGQPGGLT